MGSNEVQHLEKAFEAANRTQVPDFQIDLSNLQDSQLAGARSPKGASDSLPGADSLLPGQGEVPADRILAASIPGLDASTIQNPLRNSELKDFVEGELPGGLKIGRSGGPSLDKSFTVTEINYSRPVPSMILGNETSNVELTNVCSVTVTRDNLQGSSVVNAAHLVNNSAFQGMINDSYEINADGSLKPPARHNSNQGQFKIPASSSGVRG